MVHRVLLKLAYMNGQNRLGQPDQLSGILFVTGYFFLAVVEAFDLERQFANAFSP